MNSQYGAGARSANRFASVLILILLAAAITGCDSFLLGPFLDGESAQPLSIDPESTVVAVGATATFVAAGGYPPYTFAVDSGDGSIDSSSGVFTAPSVDGATTVNVTDLVGNSQSATITITVPTSTSINYAIDSVSWISGTLAGQAVVGSIVVTNTGEDDGTHDIGWQVYASLDGTLDLASDLLVDNGTHPAITAGVTADPIDFNGFWPTTPDTYYLIALLATTPDDPLVSNNELADGGTAVSAPPAADVDYVVTAVTNSGTPAESGSTVSESFEIQNSGPDDGASQLFWTAYISPDITAGDADDDLIDAGSLAPPNGGGGLSGPIAIDSGSWPTVGADTTYYIVVEIAASDELITGNNVTASAAFTITRPDVDYIVTSVSNSGTPASTLGPISEDFQVQNTGADNGSETVIWEARMSLDAQYDVTDTFVLSGGIGPLSTGATSAAIPVTGSWPADSGEYYLVVRVSAGDESDSTNNEGASGLFEVNAPLVDYTVTSATSTFTTVTTNSAVSESFVYKNAGNTSGAATVSYVAYASVDAVWDVGDAVIGGESLGGGSELPAGSSSTLIPISAFWPAGAGAYYLIVEVNAADDSNAANDRLAVGPFTINDPPDYEISVPAFPVVDYGGHLSVLMSVASVANGGSPTHQIQISEVDSNDGLQDITWRIYQSDDAFLDGLDVQVAGETIPRLLADASITMDVDYDLPAVWGPWHYIVTIAAGDDTNLTNNSLTVGPVPVWQIGDNDVLPTDSLDNVEIDTSDFANDGPSSADDFGVLLNPGETVFFDGFINEDGLQDTFVIRTGPGTTGFQIRATWDSSPAKDNLDLFFFGPTGAELDFSAGTDGNVEPDGGVYWVLSALTPSSTYYIAARAYLPTSDVGDSYIIEVVAFP